MRYITIEGNPKKFSTIALGSTYFGTNIDEKTAFSLLDEFANQGGTTIDTALIYGQEKSSMNSESEKVIGKWLRSNNMYKEMALVTKGLHPHLHNWESRISYENMVHDLNLSFDSLGSSIIDLWFFHRDDPSKSVHTMIDIINQVKSNFPVTTFGASNWDYKRIETSHIYSFQNKLPVIRASEIHWSLATTDGEKMGDETLTFMNDESKKWYKTHMLPLFAYSSQAKGFFSKAIKEGSIEHLNDKIKRRYVSEENLQTLKKVENMCKEIGVSPASLILSYLTSAPFPTIAIIGPSSVEQIKDSLKDSDLILTEQQRKQLE